MKNIAYLSIIYENIPGSLLSEIGNSDLLKLSNSRITVV